MIQKKKMSALESTRLLIRCFSFMEGMKAKYFFGLILGAGELAILFAIPFINKKLVEMVSGEIVGNGIREVGLLFLLLLMLTPLVALGKYWQGISTEKALASMRKGVFTHIQRLPMDSIGDLKTGDYITRMTSDVNRAGSFFQSFAIVSLVRFLVVTTIALILLFQISWQIALLAIIYCSIGGILAIRLNPYVRRLDRDVREQVSASASYLIEVMRGIPIIRIFLLKDVLIEKYRNACLVIQKKQAKFRSVNGIAYGVVDFFAFSAQAVGFLVAMLFLLKGGMELATAVFAASLMGMMADAMLRFSTFVLLIQPSIVAAQRVFEVLDSPLESQRETKVEPDVNAKTAIDLNEVTFSYPNGQEVISDLSFSIPNGERVAIVGGSGGGKTTLIKLLQSFYEPTQGEAELFGINTKEIGLADIRELFSYVPQDSTVFDGTIGENIRLGSPDCTYDEMVLASKQAGLHDFVDSLPNGYNTLIGERGSRISGGQRQRIAIARAILKDAPIFILDEATSALDSTTEEDVLSILDELLEDKTFITIAHRLSTIQKAHRILVMEGGQIVEEGAHKYLLSKNGRYSELYEKQFSGNNGV